MFMVISKFKVYDKNKEFLGILERSSDNLYRWMPDPSSERAQIETRRTFFGKSGADFTKIPFFDARIPGVDKDGYDEYEDNGTGIFFKRVPV